MRILASTPMYPPGSRVGAWLATHACLAHMVTLGHEVDVVPYMATSLGFPYDIDGVNVHPSTDLAKFEGADVVVSHLGDNQRAARIAAEWGVPSVRMAHGSSPDNAANLDAAPTALAVFNSVSLAAETGYGGPSIVVRPPFDPDTVRSTPGTSVTLVNLTEAKGGRIFWQLARSMPGVQFLGVRGGYGRQVSNKAKNATVIDQTTNMAADVYARTRVLLMPSEKETWGMVGLEAMVSGIPVIAHPTPGLLESLGDAAVFVDRDDIQGWRDQIQRLMSPSEWARASAKALAHGARYNPAPDLDRFATAVEKLSAKVAA